MRLRTLVRRILQKDDRTSWRRHLRGVRTLQAWERSFRHAHPKIPEATGEFTAIVLNYARPQNIDLLTRILLNVPSVRDVVISNNNPTWDLRDWLHASSDRIRVVDQPEAAGTAIRACIARTLRHVRFFLWMDDDIFLTPLQIERLCRALAADPSVPHGMYGQEWEGGRFRGGIAGREGRIAIISRVYACTGEHVREFFRLTDLLGFTPDHPAWRESDWDDILLSFSGNARPRIHAAGPFHDCPAQGKLGTAVWRREGFHAKREELFRRLRAIKPLT